MRQDLFHRTVDAKTKDPKVTFRAFSRMITKKLDTKKTGSTREQKSTGEFKKLSKDEGIQNYSIVSETKAAFAERTIRSLRNKSYR